MKKHRWVMLLLMLTFVLWGCGGNDNAPPPEEVLGTFLEAYQAGDADKMAENAIGGDNLLQEIDDVIALLNYDDASSAKLSEGMRTFDYEIGDVIEEDGNKATVAMGVEIPYYNYPIISDMSDLFEAEAFTFAPIENDFSGLDNAASQDLEVILIKEGDGWKVDLTEESNKYLVDAMVGHLIEASRMNLEQDFSMSVFENAVLPPMPNNEIILKDGDSERVYDVNPMQRDDRLGIPFYGEIPFHDTFYVSWQEEPPTLTAIKSPATVVTLPFKTMPLAGYELTWWDMTSATVETLEPVA